MRYIKMHTHTSENTRYKNYLKQERISGFYLEI